MKILFLLLVSLHAYVASAGLILLSPLDDGSWLRAMFFVENGQVYRRDCVDLAKKNFQSCGNVVEYKIGSLQEVKDKAKPYSSHGVIERLVDKNFHKKFTINVEEDGHIEGERFLLTLSPPSSIVPASIQGVGASVPKFKIGLCDFNKKGDAYEVRKKNKVMFKKIHPLYGEPCFSNGIASMNACVAYSAARAGCTDKLRYISKPDADPRINPGQSDSLSRDATKSDLGGKTKSKKQGKKAEQH